MESMRLQTTYFSSDLSQESSSIYQGWVLDAVYAHNAVSAQIKGAKRPKLMVTDSAVRNQTETNLGKTQTNTETQDHPEGSMAQTASASKQKNGSLCIGLLIPSDSTDKAKKDREIAETILLCNPVAPHEHHICQILTSNTNIIVYSNALALPTCQLPAAPEA